MNRNDLDKELSRRQRRAIAPVLLEYQKLNGIGHCLDGGELHRFLNRICRYETELANTPRQVMAGKGRLPVQFVDQYMGAFLDVMEAYASCARAYTDVLQLYQDFRLSVRPPVLKGKQTHVDHFLDLMNAGFSPRALGRIEAHVHIRQIARIYYARYSYERRDMPAPSPAVVANDNAPDIDLAAYRRRQNLRRSFAKGGDIPVDPAADFIYYIDHIDMCLSQFKSWRDAPQTLSDGSGTDGIAPALELRRLYGGENTPHSVWFHHVRPCFETQQFLVPGLDRLDAGNAYIDQRFGGDRAVACRRFRDGAEVWLSKIKSGIAAAREGVALNRERHHVAMLGRPTLCLFSAMQGAAYVGEALPVVMSMRQPSDVAPVAAIRHDWQPRLTSLERSKRTPAPPSHGLTRKLVRAREAQERRLQIDRDFQAAARPLTGDDQLSRAMAIQKRRDLAAQRAARRTQAVQERRAEDRRRQQAANEARAEARQSAEARRQALINSRRERYAAEASARAMSDAVRISAPPVELTSVENREAMAEKARRRRENRQKRAAARSVARRQNIAAKRPDRRPKPDSDLKPG